MKKYLRISTLVIFAASLVFTSCKKDDETSIGGPEQLASATGKKWTITAYQATYKVTGMADETEDLSQWKACEKDNLLIFFSDKKLELREGTTKCYTEDLIEDGTWSISGGKLTFTEDSDQITMTIKELTATSLKLEVSEKASFMGVVIGETHETRTYTASN